MNSLKDKFEYIDTQDFDVIKWLKAKDVKDAILEDKEFFNICKEHILKELKKHSNKTSYNVVERLLNNYSFIKKDILGEWENYI